MVIIKSEVLAITAIKNGRIQKTTLSLDSDNESLDTMRLYLGPLVNEFVRRRILPGLDSDGNLTVQNRIKIRESKTTQTVTIEQVSI